MRAVQRMRLTSASALTRPLNASRLQTATSTCSYSLTPSASSLTSHSLTCNSSLITAPSVAASFHTSSQCAAAAPAASAKPAAPGKPGAGGAGGAPSGESLKPPAEGTNRWYKEGWHSPRLVPIVRPGQKLTSSGLVADAASDAIEEEAALEIPTLHAEVRENVGSKYSRYLRSQRQLIPGIINDRSAPRRNQLLITLDRFELEALARKYRRTLLHKVIHLQIPGQEPIKVIADEITRHAVTNELLVANWFLFKPNREKVKIRMPIVYTGTEECIGVKRGGVIVILRDHVPCVWTGNEHIPPFIHIDMANTDGGKVFRNSDLSARMPPGLRLFDPLFDYVVATVLGVKSKDGNAVEEETTAAAATTAQQPSVIQLEKEKKEKERREEEEMVAQKLAQAKAKGKK